MDLHDPIEQLYVTRDGGRLAAVVHAQRHARRRHATRRGDRRHRDGTTELAPPDDARRDPARQLAGRARPGRRRPTASRSSTRSPARSRSTVDVGGPVTGVVGINDIDERPGLRHGHDAARARRSRSIIAEGQGPGAGSITTFALPGDRRGPGLLRPRLEDGPRRGDGRARAAIGPSAAPARPTIYVIEPHGNAVYADSPLPVHPAAIVMDDNQEYPSTDRQELLALDAGGAGGVGRDRDARVRVAGPRRHRRRADGAAAVRPRSAAVPAPRGGRDPRASSSSPTGCSSPRAGSA